MAHLAANNHRVVAHDPTIHDRYLHDTIMEQHGKGWTSILKTGLAGLLENVWWLPKGTSIFPRLDMEEEIAYIQSQMTAGQSHRKRMDSKKWNSEVWKWRDKGEDFEARLKSV